MHLYIATFLSLTAPWASFCFQPTPVPFPTRQQQHAPTTTHSSLLSMAASDDGKDDATPTRLRIEYCTGCRWMLKSFWMAQELLTTFEEEVDAISVVPSSSKGIYAITLNGSDLLWDRKEQGGFPSTKELKQIIRDKVTPAKFLGHSDTKERQDEGKEDGEGTSDEVPLRGEEETNLILPDSEAPAPAVAITYCTGCRWMLRAAYFGQELLTTFGDGELSSVTLVPSKPPAKGGQFSIKLDGEYLFDRATEGRFPEVKEIKQMIRDKLVPDKDLGHSDVHYEKEVDEMDGDEAEEQRKFFGVA